MKASKGMTKAEYASAYAWVMARDGNAQREKPACQDCGHRNHLGGCQCRTKECACSKARASRNAARQSTSGRSSEMPGSEAVTGTIDKQRTCLRCGGPIRAANVNGYCSQSKECIAARNKALRLRDYDKSRDTRFREALNRARAESDGDFAAKARALADGPDEAKMLENNMRWYAEYVADRRQRGIPEKGLPVKTLRS